MRHVRSGPPRAACLATGIHGRIVWHEYAVAADVEGFSVDRDERGGLFLRAAVRHADDFKLQQSPLTFIVTLQRGEWRWPIDEVLSYRADALFARLRPAVPVLQ